MRDSSGQAGECSDVQEVKATSCVYAVCAVCTGKWEKKGDGKLNKTKKRTQMLFLSKTAAKDQVFCFCVA